MQPNLTMVLEQVGKDKGIDVKILLQTLEQAILTAAKKVFGQHREVEAQFNEEKDRKGELIAGVVRRFERGNIIVEIGRNEAILPVREQVPRESYRSGDRIVAYVAEVEKNARGPQIVLSRTHKGLLEKLFET